MKCDLNIKRSFTINGKTYGSLEEVPPEMRTAIEHALKAPSGGTSAGMPGPGSTIIFNGTEYAGVDAMPADVRSLYESILKAAAAQGGITLPGQPDARGAARGPLAAEPAFSPGSLLAGTAIIVLLVLAYYLLS